MAIIRLQHIGIVVREFDQACRQFDQVLGMKARDFRDDQSGGQQHDSRVLLGNECWIHVVYNWNPEKRPYLYLQEHGIGLEHIALESDDIEGDVQRIRDLGVPIFQDEILDANDGYEAFVYPERGIGFTVELIQPHPTSWVYPSDARNQPVSSKLAISAVRRLVAVVADVAGSLRRFERLFGLEGHAGRIPLGNNCTLELVGDSKPAPRNRGLKEIVLATRDLASDLETLEQSSSLGPEGIVEIPPLGFPIRLEQEGEAIQE